MTLRQALKAGTDDLHEALDTHLARFDLGDERDYRSFLRIHARVLPPIEQALEAAGIAALLKDWGERRRAPLIERDLAALGEPVPPPIVIPAIHGTPQLLGTAYVVEGSRLGSRFLARRVGGAMPAEYLNAAGQQKAWPALLAALDSADFVSPDRERAVGAARACFASFLDAASEVTTDG